MACAPAELSSLTRALKLSSLGRALSLATSSFSSCSFSSSPHSRVAQGFKYVFRFGLNEYFENRELFKQFKYNKATGDLMVDQTEIKWKPGKNLCDPKDVSQLIAGKQVRANAPALSMRTPCLSRQAPHASEALAYHIAYSPCTEGCAVLAAGHRVSRPWGTGSVGDSVGEGLMYDKNFDVLSAPS